MLGVLWRRRPFRSAPVLKRIPNINHLVLAVLLSALIGVSACNGSSSETVLVIPSATASPTAAPTAVPTGTQTPTATPTPTSTPTATSTPAPGSHLVRGLLQQSSYGYAAVVLASGQVLIAGGANNLLAALPNAAIYDPASGTMRPTGAPMHAARRIPAAVLLKSGKVLIAGGRDQNFHALDSAEIYDPVADTFTLTSGVMSSARENETANLLGDGTVLVAGGSGQHWPCGSER